MNVSNSTELNCCYWTKDRSFSRWPSIKGHLKTFFTYQSPQCCLKGSIKISLKFVNFVVKFKDFHLSPKRLFRPQKVKFIFLLFPDLLLFNCIFIPLRKWLSGGLTRFTMWGTGYLTRHMTECRYRNQYGLAYYKLSCNWTCKICLKCYNLSIMCHIFQILPLIVEVIMFNVIIKYLM